MHYILQISKQERAALRQLLRRNSFGSTELAAVYDRLRELAPAVAHAKTEAGTASALRESFDLNERLLALQMGEPSAGKGPEAIRLETAGAMLRISKAMAKAEGKATA